MYRIWVKKSNISRLERNFSSNIGQHMQNYMENKHNKKIYSHRPCLKVTEPNIRNCCFYIKFNYCLPSDLASVFWSLFTFFFGTYAKLFVSSFETVFFFENSAAQIQKRDPFMLFSIYLFAIKSPPY